ncbi:hypothetical protein H2200_011118 [Cladophialophora chaetospira]|uniref:RING-type domain-containing protein n=1 Tax=Cladophialophora chaetospira TaxID=386627 RepID=A0AA38X010_9EURO|nr:hypothetical protein H2200_011118 [Cladophialophora chaetospira]
MSSTSPEPTPFLFLSGNRPALPHDPSRQRPSPQPLRRSSPRLFRDFFSAMSDTASRRHATLPRPFPSNQDPLHSVNQALENANRAIQDAQEAFHVARRLTSESEARRLRTDSEAPGQLVDLTRTSSPPLPALHNPGAAESHYISHTTHPHDSFPADRSRRSNILHQPVYPPIPHLERGSPPNYDAHNLPHYHRGGVRFWPGYRQTGPPGDVHLPRIRTLGEGRLPSAFGGSSTVEEEAITRQRENHSNWERTQARNRERQLHQEVNQQAQDNSQQSSPSNMSPPSSSSSRPTTRSSRRRHSTPQLPSDPSIDEVDLTAVDDPASLSAALSKQREDAILAQNPGTEAGRTPLTAYKCPVCMDSPTDATSTACGHVFCHRCIIDTLNWSIEQRREDAPANRKVKGVCPVCRKPLDLKDTPGSGRSLVPLELKLLVKKRKRDPEPEPRNGKGKAKLLVKAETLSDDEETGYSGTSRTRKQERESTEDAIWSAFTYGMDVENT